MYPKARRVSGKHVPGSAGEGLGPGFLVGRGRRIGAEGPRGVTGVGAAVIFPTARSSCGICSALQQ